MGIGGVVGIRVVVVVVLVPGAEVVEVVGVAGMAIEQLAVPSAPVTVVTTETEVIPGPPLTVRSPVNVPSAAVAVVAVMVPWATIVVGRLAVGGVTKPSTRIVTVALDWSPLNKVTVHGSFIMIPLVAAWAGKAIWPTIGWVHFSGRTL